MCQTRVAEAHVMAKHCLLPRQCQRPLQCLYQHVSLYCRGQNSHRKNRWCRLQHLTLVVYFMKYIRLVWCIVWGPKILLKKQRPPPLPQSNTNNCKKKNQPNLYLQMITGLLFAKDSNIIFMEEHIKCIDHLAKAPGAAGLWLFALTMFCAQFWLKAFGHSNVSCRWNVHKLCIISVQASRSTHYRYTAPWSKGQRKLWDWRRRCLRKPKTGCTSMSWSMWRRSSKPARPNWSQTQLSQTGRSLHAWLFVDHLMLFVFVHVIYWSCETFNVIIIIIITITIIITIYERLFTDWVSVHLAWQNLNIWRYMQNFQPYFPIHSMITGILN